MENTNERLFSFISRCPTPYHTAAEAAQTLKAAGFCRLDEADKWELTPGRGYFVTRGDSALIAFWQPERPCGFAIAAAHTDAPALRVKENPEIAGEGCVRLSVEKYGGPMAADWLNRPLAAAGRLLVRTAGGAKTLLADTKEPVAVIPAVAVHLTEKEGAPLNPAVDLAPLYGGEAGSLRAQVAASAGVAAEDILSWDLQLYPVQQPVAVGSYICAPRLDDLQCVFAALAAFTAATPAGAPVLALFDNEEVGSTTPQGADSTFLADVLRRVCADGEDYRRRLAESLLLSCDNAHARHPNHPELADGNHTAVMNGGVVIKYNAARRYASDAVSAGLFRLICERAGVPVQVYANRADMRGGSTLGAIAAAQVSVPCVDIGLAQLAMHGAVETAGAQDTAYMTAALTKFFATRLTRTGEEYTLE